MHPFEPYLKRICVYLSLHHEQSNTNDLKDCAS